MEDVSTSRLSTTQKAYQEDPEGFLARLRERAGGLFEKGYRVLPGDEPHLFLVVTPEAKGAKPYRVNARMQTCDCAFYAWQAAGEQVLEEGRVIPCKHTLGLSPLVRKTRRERFQAGRVTDFCKLTAHWMKHLSRLRRERIAAEAGADTGRRACSATGLDGSGASRPRQFAQGWKSW